MTSLVIPNTQVVTLSPEAESHFAAIASGKIVKFGVEGGGCAGFQYRWDVLESKDNLYPDDEVVEYDCFTFVVDGSSLMMLVGSRVDYVSDITGNRIDVVNPLASAGCGCGVSVNFK